MTGKYIGMIDGGDIITNRNAMHLALIDLQEHYLQIAPALGVGASTFGCIMTHKFEVVADLSFTRTAYGFTMTFRSDGYAADSVKAGERSVP